MLVKSKLNLKLSFSFDPHCVLPLRVLVQDETLCTLANVFSLDWLLSVKKCFFAHLFGFNLF